MSSLSKHSCREDAIFSPGQTKIGILGCGAMGSVYAALLASAGNEVWAVDVWKDHIEAIRRNGLRVSGASGDRTTPIHATTDAADVGSCDLVIVATKASGVGDAAKVAQRGMLKRGGVILTIQNGLGSGERIAQHVSSSDVMLGVANNFGASMKGLGHAEHASMNLICIGEMTGGNTERLAQIVNVWSAAGFKVEGNPDIEAKIWEKLVCNCTYSGPCTVTGLTVGEVQDDAAAWSVALSCAREVDAVARKVGVNLPYDDVEEFVTKFGSTVRAVRPSMLQDHFAKRRSEVDAINGAVSIVAEKVGMVAPVNEAVANLVRARENHF